MNNKLLIYSTKHGATKEYAEKIASEISADIFDLKDIDMETVQDSQYEVVIYGGPVYMSKITGLTKFAKYVANFEKSKVIIFGVGAAYYSDNYLAQVKKENTFENLQNAQYHYFQGKIDINKLPLPSKIIVKGLISNTEAKDPKTYSELENAVYDYAKNPNINWMNVEKAAAEIKKSL